MKSYASVPVKTKLGKSQRLIMFNVCRKLIQTNPLLAETLPEKNKKPPLPSVNRVDSLNSSGIQPAVISDLKPSATYDQEHTCKGLF